MLTTATSILTAFLKQDTSPDDIDRLVAMSAYMAKRLEADMLKPLQQLEIEVWPELVLKTADTKGDSHDTVL